MKNARAALSGNAVADVQTTSVASRRSFRGLAHAAIVSSRFTAHLVTVCIVLAVLLVAQLGPSLIEVQGSSPLVVLRGAIASADMTLARNVVGQSDVAAPLDALPETRAIDAQLAPAFSESHTVAEGETIAQIAAQYEISVAALFWANDLGTENVFAAGQELRIPRLEGVPYTIQEGDTLASIAAKFGVRPQAITLFKANAIQPDATLPIGQELFIPNGIEPYPAELLSRLGGDTGIANITAVAAGTVREAETNLRAGPGRGYEKLGVLDAGSRLRLLARHSDWAKVENGVGQIGWVRSDLLGLGADALAAVPETNDFPALPPVWMWPTQGRITSPFGWRSSPFRSFHDGLDIANSAWTQIYAARSGQVIESGWCSGFGYCVKIDHGDGITTIYGHLIKKPPVKVGDTVDVGELIGYMGSTYDRSGGGYSTGVHLHFTVKINGKAVNPKQFLP